MHHFPPLIYVMFIVAVSKHKEFLFSMPFVTRFLNRLHLFLDNLSDWRWWRGGAEMEEKKI